MTKNTIQSPHIKDLLLLFGVPLGILLITAAAIYVPRLLANPQTDFVYTTCESYACRSSFEVNGTGNISEVSISRSHNDYTASLHYYDASDNSTKKITLDEARRYTLDTTSRSPDGYALVRESQDTGFLFWSDHDTGWYLENGAIKKPVDIVGIDSYYSQDVKFLGWVE